MITTVLPFLDDLRKNNDREWFQKNKSRYEQAKNEFEAFLGLVIPAITEYNPEMKFIEPRDCLFRIFRDVRFSKDKSPYKINMGGWITSAGRKSSGPGFYIHLQPGASFLSAGVHMPDPEKLKKIRKEIYYNIDEFKSILSGKNFKKHFSGIDEWDKQKLPPREFPKDFSEIDLLKNRSYSVSHSLKESTISNPGLFEYVMTVFKVTLPYNAFLKRALEG